VRVAFFYPHLKAHRKVHQHLAAKAGQFAKGKEAEIGQALEKLLSTDDRLLHS